MSQQVNLYQPIFRKERRKFSATTMLQATALMVFGIGLMYGHTYWQVRQLRAEAAQTDKQLVNLTKRMDETARQFGERLQSKDLQAQVQKLQEQVSEKQRLQHILQSAQFNTQGFSDYFIAFARQHIPGVWITGLDITGAADQMTLSGRSTNPELVPRYLQKLSAEKRLSGIEFRTFQMSRGGADAKGGATSYVDFMAKTADPGAPGTAPKGSP
ncbi:MAG TPA: PilN domain-containing protein [Burkholderiales bacterium]|nr:PilN domain-containing protein [Burkholderiales bacterium]